MSATLGDATDRPAAHNPARWFLAAGAVIGFACVPGIFLLQRRSCGVEQFPAALSPVIFVAMTLSGILGIVNGIIISFRQPRNRIGLLCETTGVLGLVTALSNRYALCGIYGQHPLPGVLLAAWVCYILAPFVIALVFWQIPFWFPFGQYLSQGWRFFAILAWSILLAGIVLVGILPGPLAGNGVLIAFPIQNPVGVRGLDIRFLERNAPNLVMGLLLGITLAANLSLVLRWRKAHAEERQQIKWFAFFVGCVVSIFIFIMIIGQVFMPDLFHSPVYVIAFYLAWIGFPVVIGLSVLKYRLYDIDIVIRRTLLYAGVSLLLALVYLISVTLLQLAFAGVSGQRSQAAIVISTLLIAALFSPLRRVLQAAIDRRFYRSKYDAARTLELFSASVRDEVELKQLLVYLEAAVDDTLQPEAVSVWLSQASDRYSLQGEGS